MEVVLLILPVTCIYVCLQLGLFVFCARHGLCEFRMFIGSQSDLVGLL